MLQHWVCERKRATLGESCTSKHWSSSEPWRHISGTASALWNKRLVFRTITISCFRAVPCGQSFQILRRCDSAPHCDGKRHQHRWEQLQRTCHVHLFTKRHVSQRWRHEQQLSSIGLRRQALRYCGISRSLCLSKSRSGPGVRIRVGDVEKLQFLSEFGEGGGFIASDKGVVFFDNHDTQRGEAQITYKNDDLYHVASFSFLPHVAELVADLSNLALSVVHDTATTLLARLPPQHRRSMSGKGSGGSCLSRHRAWCAGAGSELSLGTVSAHLDLVS